jgi:hypothetical protein
MESKLSPGSLLEKHSNGELGLYAGVPVATNVKNEGKIVHYLKDVFPNNSTPNEVKQCAFEVYMTLKRENNYG